MTRGDPPERAIQLDDVLVDAEGDVLVTGRLRGGRCALRLA